MTDDNQMAQYAYMVNNTRKEILKIPLDLTQKVDGFVSYITEYFATFKICWKLFRDAGWNGFDDIDIIKDELNEYQNKGYVLK